VASDIQSASQLQASFTLGDWISRVNSVWMTCQKAPEAPTIKINTSRLHITHNCLNLTGKMICYRDSSKSHVDSAQVLPLIKKVMPGAGVEDHWVSRM
jgi:hypothetical protein